MKKIFLLLTIITCVVVANAQQKPTDLDNSPLDVSYFPPNYPILKLKGNNVPAEPMARVLYSRPQKKGRVIFGGEVKFNEIWRLGANEATEIEFFKNATVAGKKISKGRYSLFCIPSDNKWTLIFNRDNYNWGSFMYKADKDALRVDVPVQRSQEMVEALTIYFDNNGGNNMIIMWDDVKVVAPILF